MKSKILRQIIIMSRLAIAGILLQCVFYSLLTAADGKAQHEKLSEIILTVNFKGKSLSRAFHEIEEKTQLKFAYNHQRINEGMQLDIEAKDESLANLLREISKDAGLRFKRINEKIYVNHQEGAKEEDNIEEILDPVQLKVSGTVTSSEDGAPLPGVSIVVQGTTKGTTSDFDGKFSIEVAEDAVLIFSYIGYTKQEVPVNSRSTIDIVMNTDAEQLQEVVVTAFGLEREKKAITYSAQTVEVKEFSEARSLNIVNSLSGRVAGLNMSTASNGVGSSSRVVLRGNRSLLGNNQPLYVIDGMPIDNSTSGTPSDETGGTTGSDGISNINPEDIASISVLKGPSAAALYGTRASNGVIIINTKSGKGKTGTSINFASNFTLNSPYLLLDIQNQYGQGSNGVYSVNETRNWGPELDGSSVAAWQLEHNPDYEGPATYSYSAQPDNIIDFFQTGYNLANTVSATMGNNVAQGYFSYTNTKAEGVVPGNELNRNNANVRITSKLSEKLQLDAKINFIQQTIDNPVRSGEDSPTFGAYTLPRNLPYSQYKDYEYIDASGNLQYNYINRDAVGANSANPFWLVYRHNTSTITRNRVIGFASATYEFLEGLKLNVRSGIDQYTDKSETKSYATVAWTSDLGNYYRSYRDVMEWNSSFLLSYDKDINNFSVNVNFGGNALTQQRNALTAGGMLSRRNFFAISNTDNPVPTESPYEREINSLYGFAQIGYKNVLFLDVTGRNDWSSTLPADNRSFFYPSIGLSAVVSDMFTSLPEALTYAKLRVSYAQVGNDTDPYRLNPYYTYSSANDGMVFRNEILFNQDLRPEITSSTEFGADVRFLDNRLGLDFTWFKSNTVDQVFPVATPESSGYSSQYINAGEIQNTGVELVLSATPVQTTDFSWDITANFSSYNSKVVSINGDTERLVLNSGGRSVNAIITKGGEYGDFYVKGYERDDEGNILINENGLPETTSDYSVKAGNFNPDWSGGLQNRFNYKNFSMSFLIDARIGGEIFSFTRSVLSYTGSLESTLAGRDGFVVDGVVATRDDDGNIVSTTPNTTTVTAEEYWTAIAGSSPNSAEDFILDATNIRLREFVLGYTFPSSLLDKTPFARASLSLVGRNLFFFMNKAKYFDPEQAAGISNFQGIESYSLPPTRTYGVSLKFGF